MRKYLCLAFFLSLTSCSYSINMVHSEGTATDVIDDTQTPSTSVDAHA